MEKVKSILITILMLMLSALGVITDGFYSAQASTLDTRQAIYEQQNIMDDLEGSTVNGKKFALSDYPYKADGSPQVISFIEFCYSSVYEKQSDFGLYIYVYNPARMSFNHTNENNCIELRTGGDKSESFSNNYKLKYLNYGAEGLFWKFKIDLTSVQKQGILKRVQSDERIYEVSGFELMVGSFSVEEYPVWKTYRYSGYAEGCAPTAEQDGTLSCEAEGGMVTLSFDVHSTAYRPNGSNGKNVYTQDSLHSVYFAVPNEIIERYGEMSQIHAKWLNATLKPGLVTGNREVYEKLLPFIAHQIPFSNMSNYESYGVDWNYAYLGAVDKIVTPKNGTWKFFGFGVWSSEIKEIGEREQYKHREDIYGEELDELPILLYASNGNADRSKFESAEELLSYVKKYPSVCPDNLDPLSSLIISGATPGGTGLVAGKYPITLFSKYDTEYTEVKVNADEKKELKNYKVDTTWWSKLGIFGTGYEQEKQPFESVQAIQDVKESDFLGSEDEICKRLAVGKTDLADFKDFYETNKEDSTVFLFRYYVGDYIAQEATLYKENSFLGMKNLKEVDTNAYFFQTDVNLNFDIIDISYDNGVTVTTIPVVMSPIDVIPNPTPPLIITPDFVWWPYGVGIMCALVVVLIVTAIIDKGVKKECSE